MSPCTPARTKTATVLLTILLFTREVWRRFNKGEDDRTTYRIHLSAATGIVAMAFQEVVGFSLQTPGSAELVCLLGAVAIRKASSRRPKTRRK